MMGAPSDLRAQVRIEGRVIDNESLAPVPEAEVRLYNARLDWKVIDRTFTDPSGAFSFTVEDENGYIFQAKRIGYAVTETPVLWTDGYREYRVEIRLDPDAVLLAPIEVVARVKGRESPVLSNFQHRAESGFGHYITHEDIQRLDPSRVTDLLAHVPGVRLESSGAGLRRDVYLGGRTGLAPCKAQIFLDGMRWSRRLLGEAQSGYTVDDAVLPADVFGIEVYTGVASIPAEFLTPESQCGVVAIWTRR